MIVLCVTNCPQGLRGDLSKWLSEVNTGVYVGRLNARVREELWDRVCSNIKSGQATMVYSTNNEQGYVFLTHNTTWAPVDYEGITLMRKPLTLNENGEEALLLQAGFSKAAKYEKMKRINSNQKAADYVIIDVETTGSDDKNDRIIEIGLLRISGSKVEREFQCFVQSGKRIPENIVRLTGITNEMVERQGIEEETAFGMVQEFIGDSLIVGYNVQFDINFLQQLGERVGKKIVIKKTRDVLRLARWKLDDLKDYKLETVAAHFSFDISNTHRALTDCRLTHEIYLELNKL